MSAAASLLINTAQAADWKPDPTLGDPAQHLRLYNIGRRYGDEHYDDTVGLIKPNPNKKGGHILRESTYYAYALLMTGDPEDLKRAEKILPIVLSHQELNKDRHTYGNIPYNLYDNLETMPNADLNNTQFTGLALADIIELDQKRHVLPEELRKQVEASFRLAVDATIRRDVDPGYTNISLASAAVGAAGEKLFGIPGAGDFAMSKLSWFLARALPGSTTREYLAPTYYAADLGAAYAARNFASTPALVDAADRVINALWRDIADSYHAQTFQLAGPHSRAYGDNMLDYTAGLKYFLYLALDGKYPIRDVETAHNWDTGGLAMLAAAPVKPRPEFHDAPAPWRVLQVAGAPGMLLSQYRQGDFILGSVSTQSLWQQQQSVVAYWPVTVPSWHVGFCIDVSAETFGNGYAHYYSVQSKGAVLAAVTGKLPVPPKGGLEFAFNTGAQPDALAGGLAGACVVHDGDVTTYIYPVSQQSSSGPTFDKDETKGRVYVERPWASADPAGAFNVLGYLVVFQLPGEPVPAVKDVSIKVAGENTMLSADVNGVPLSLKVPR